MSIRRRKNESEESFNARRDAAREERRAAMNREIEKLREELGIGKTPEALPPTPQRNERRMFVLGLVADVTNALTDLRAALDGNGSNEDLVVQGNVVKDRAERLHRKLCDQRDDEGGSPVSVR